MAKKKRKTHLNATMEPVWQDAPLDVPSIIVLSLVGLLAFTYLYFAVVALYRMVVAHV